MINSNRVNLNINSIKEEEGFTLFKKLLLQKQVGHHGGKDGDDGY